MTTKINTESYDVAEAKSITIATQVMPAHMQKAIDAALALGWRINSVHSETTVESTQEWVVLVRVRSTE